jgi:hypothetical protein
MTFVFKFKRKIRLSVCRDFIPQIARQNGSIDPKLHSENKKVTVNFCFSSVTWDLSIHFGVRYVV